MQTLALLLAIATHSAFAAPEPLYEWEFAPRTVSGDVLRAQLGNLPGRLVNSPQLGREPDCLDFAGTGYVELAPKGTLVHLPARDITVEAWVSLRNTPQWGGYVGYFQDNGTFEKGWILGNNGDRFCFAVSSVGADDGDGLLTYLPADRPIDLRKWTHVTGTYDGRALRLYVDGSPAASSEAQSGDIAYAEAPLAIGVYLDDNEMFPMDGAIHSVRIYDVALTAEQVKARYDATRDVFAGRRLSRTSAPQARPLIDGPWVSFADQGSATVRWDTPRPAPTVLDFGRPGEEPRRIEHAAPTTTHAVTLGDLQRNTEYTYRVIIPGPDGDEATESFILDTEFDFTIRPLPDAPDPYPADGRGDLYADAARRILEATGIDRGYCLDYGCGDGRLALELARRSRLQVIGVSEDEQAVRRGRQTLVTAGLYGSRITLRHVKSLADLPLADLTANLIVSAEALDTGRAPGAAAEAISMLRPAGGVACLYGRRAELQDWLAATPVPDEGLSGFHQRPAVRWEDDPSGAMLLLGKPDKLPGAGEWTHAYGDPGQSGNSWDELVTGTAGETLEVQWFGLPGPNAMIDRQTRGTSSLSTNGRLFAQGNERIITLDAYNGAILWSLEIPGLRRSNIPRNAGNTCANDDYLFAALRDHCWRLDAATGRRSHCYPVGFGDAQDPYQWGYVGTVADKLLGSAVRVGNTETGWIGPQFWFDGLSGKDTYNVCSDALFCLRIEDGARIWTHTGALVINPTISIGNDRVYFLESRSKDAIELEERQIGADLWEDVWLVALDLSTGDKCWERPFEHPQQPIVVYLVHHGEQVAISTSFAGKYHVRAFSDATGEDRWQVEHPWRSDNHGHHIQHPVIAQGKLFLEPAVYQWQTGAAVEIEFPGRNKCGTLSAAANLLHYRDYNDEVWDLATNTQSEFNRLRSNCWIGMISGSGLLLSPESGGGCSCSWPVYTSLAYRTKDDY